MLQILMDGPYQDNYLIIPDSSGIFVVDAFEPLFIDTGGAVYLAEDLITSVGQLVAGSIGRGFGKPFVADIAPNCQYKILTQFCCLLGSKAVMSTCRPSVVHG